MAVSSLSTNSKASLITHEFKLDQIKEAFELVDKDDTAIKVILRP